MTVDHLQGLDQVHIQRCRKKWADAIRQRNSIQNKEKSIIHPPSMQQPIILQRPPGNSGNRLLQASPRGATGQSTNEVFIQVGLGAGRISFCKGHRSFHSHLFSRFGNLKHDLQELRQIGSYSDAPLLGVKSWQSRPQGVEIKGKALKDKPALGICDQGAIETRDGMGKNDLDPRQDSSGLVPYTALNGTHLNLGKRVRNDEKRQQNERNSSSHRRFRSSSKVEISAPSGLKLCSLEKSECRKMISPPCRVMRD